MSHGVINVANNCTTCKRYKEMPPRPTGGLSMATEFQEMVAMDLKFYNSKILLRLFNHSTWLSASSFIPNKIQDTILTYILKIWISVHGAPEKYLTDNGGFANSKIIEMAESFGIKVKPTVGESSWSYRLIKWHNLVLAEMLDQVLENTQYHLDLGASRCTNAKKSPSQYPWILSVS